MLAHKHPARICVSFDHHRLVADGGLLPSNLALRLGLGELVDTPVDLGMPRAGPTPATS